MPRLIRRCSPLGSTSHRRAATSPYGPVTFRSALTVGSPISVKPLLVVV